MRADHDVICKMLGPRRWAVKCFTCGFEAVDLWRKESFQIRREHIEATCDPPDREPELRGELEYRGCYHCGWEDHVVADCPNRGLLRLDKETSSD